MLSYTLMFELFISVDLKTANGHGTEMQIRLLLTVYQFQ